MNTGIFDFANRETPGLTGVNDDLLAPSKTVFRGAAGNKKDGEHANVLDLFDSPVWEELSFELVENILEKDSG